MSDPIVESVIEKLRSRSVRGLDKYGVGLDREDLSVVEWLTHHQEELLDAAGYVEVLIQKLGEKKPKIEKETNIEFIAKHLKKAQQNLADKWPPCWPQPIYGPHDGDAPKPIVYGPPPPTIPKATFDPNTIICQGEKA